MKIYLVQLTCFLLFYFWHRERLHRLVTWLKSSRFKFILEGKFYVTLFSLYVGAYHIASNKYEQQLMRLEYTFSNFASQSDTSNWKDMIHVLIKLQNELINIKPEFLSPSTVYDSFLDINKIADSSMGSEVHNFIRRKRSELNNANLSKLVIAPLYYMYPIEQFESVLNLDNKYQTNFSYSNFESSLLRETIFGFVNLEGSNFSSSFLKDNKITACNLIKSNFSGAVLLGDVFNKKFSNDASYSNFENAFLKGVDLNKVIITGSNFSGAYLFGVDLSSHDLSNIKLENIVYNSVDILESDWLFYVKIIKEFQEQHCLKGNRLHHESCALIQTYPFFELIKGVPSTKFPLGFDPFQDNIVDLSKVTEKAKYLNDKEAEKYLLNFLLHNRHNKTLQFFAVENGFF